MVMWSRATTDRGEGPVGKVAALVRASWLSAASYRMRMAFSLAALLGSVIPVYFVAGALQPVMAESIRGEGEQYFGFLVVGMVALAFVRTSVGSIPGRIGSGITTGTLEALLSTPTRLPTLLAGLSGFGFVWTAMRASLLLGAAWVLGARVAPSGLAAAFVIVGFIVVAHVPFGVMAGAMVLAFRTSGPIPGLITTLSALLGGVYYPTQVIPSWIQDVSAAFPLTYGLRALRPVLMEGASLENVAADLAVLGLITVVLTVFSSLLFAVAFRYARRSGSLAQY